MSAYPGFHANVVLKTKHFDIFMDSITSRCGFIQSGNIIY